jgi:uncharacterized protein YjbI with pentapeptide repeats
MHSRSGGRAKPPDAPPGTRLIKARFQTARFQTAQFAKAKFAKAKFAKARFAKGSGLSSIQGRDPAPSARP